MKKSTLVFVALSSCLLATESDKPMLAWVDKHVEAIKPPRKGIQPEEFLGLKDPFKLQIAIDNTPKEANNTRVTAQPVEADEPIPLMALQSILNATSALINGKWYQKEDDVMGFTIREINQKSVLLTRKKKKLLLTLATVNPNIKITAK